MTRECLCCSGGEALADVNLRVSHKITEDKVAHRTALLEQDPKCHRMPVHPCRPRPPHAHMPACGLGELKPSYRDLG